MEHYIEIAARHVLSGLEALEFASKQHDKDQEREERKLVKAAVHCIRAHAYALNLTLEPMGSAPTGISALIAR